MQRQTDAKIGPNQDQTTEVDPPRKFIQIVIIIIECKKNPSRLGWQDEGDLGVWIADQKSRHPSFHKNVPMESMDILDILAHVQPGRTNGFPRMGFRLGLNLMFPTIWGPPRAGRSVQTPDWSVRIFRKVTIEQDVIMIVPSKRP